MTETTTRQKPSKTQPTVIAADNAAVTVSPANNMQKIQVIPFDKDGTLLDFNRIWLPPYRHAAGLCAESGIMMVKSLCRMCYGLFFTLWR